MGAITPLTPRSGQHVSSHAGASTIRALSLVSPRLMLSLPAARSLPPATPLALDRSWDGSPPCRAQVDPVEAHSPARRRPRIKLPLLAPV
jgi:hypothetical protein